jgi:hypothetical protein
MQNSVYSVTWFYEVRNGKYSKQMKNVFISTHNTTEMAVFPRFQNVYDLLLLTFLFNKFSISSPRIQAELVS